MEKYEKLSREQLIAQLNAVQATLKGDMSESQTLLHNLQVHQIELEMQNRELRETHTALEVARNNYAELYSFAPVGYLTLNMQGWVREANLTAAEMLGVGRAALLDSPLTTFLAAHESGRLLAHLRDALATGKRTTTELKLTVAHGHAMHVRMETIARIQKEPKTYFTALIDITQRKQAEDELRKAYEGMEATVRVRTRELAESVAALRREMTQREARERELAQLYENASEAIMVADASRKVVGANRAFTRITGFSVEEAAGKDLGFLQPKRENDRYRDKIVPALEASAQWQGENWFYRKSGEDFPVWESISVLKDPDGHATRYLCLFSDITAMKAVAQELDRLAHTDPLTGIPNRLAFATRLDSAIARAKRHTQRLALLYMDVDRFKEINDSLGHEGGDHLLAIVAQRLTGCVREEDTVARLGGDEFAVILDEINNPDDAAKLAQQILRAIDAPIAVDGVHITTSVSIGISIYPDHARDRAHLVSAADTAMYDAKKHGTHCYRFYS